MVIEDNKVVSVHYTLQESTAEGQLIESTKGAEPLVFIFGVGMMIPDFEANLKGLQPGDPFAFGIQASDAYGEYIKDEIIELPKWTFEVDGEIPDGLLEIGNTIPMMDQSYNSLEGTVLAIGEENVKVDFNHPLAGVDLFFTGHIESIRDAEPEELEHGHVHGDGGHDH